MKLTICLIFAFLLQGAVFGQACNTIPLIFEFPFSFSELKSDTANFKAFVLHGDEKIGLKGLEYHSHGRYFDAFAGIRLSIWASPIRNILADKDGGAECFYLSLCKDAPFLEQDSLIVEFIIAGRQPEDCSRIKVDLLDFYQFFDADAIYLGKIPVQPGTYKLSLNKDKVQSDSRIKLKTMKYYYLNPALVLARINE